MHKTTSNFIIMYVSELLITVKILFCREPNQQRRHVTDSFNHMHARQCHAMLYR
jgi:hypothetical protein